MNPTPEQVVQAEAEERAVMRQARDALQKTMAAWGGTCAWHADVKAAIAALDAYAAGVKTGDTDRQREARAREIYESWRGQKGWVPWVEGGNSLMQDKARREAAAGVEGQKP